MLKFTTATLLVFVCLVWAGCRISSGLNQRLAKLAAPPLARSAGGSYSTTDTYLRTLEIAAPSQRVLAAISALPKEDAILFIAPNQDAETELMYRAIASLSWPHEVGALHCHQGRSDGANHDQPALLFAPRADKKTRWLLLYQLPPSQPSTVVAEIGPHLKLIRVEEPSRNEAGTWTSYCSQ